MLEKVYIYTDKLSEEFCKEYPSFLFPNNEPIDADEGLFEEGVLYYVHYFRDRRWRIGGDNLEDFVYDVGKPHAMHLVYTGNRKFKLLYTPNEITQ